MKQPSKPIEDIEVIYQDPLNPPVHLGIKDIRDIEVEYVSVEHKK